VDEHPRELVSPIKIERDLHFKAREPTVYIEAARKAERIVEDANASCGSFGQRSFALAGSGSRNIAIGAIKSSLSRVLDHQSTIPTAHTRKTATTIMSWLTTCYASWK
jgi:hypothetical protein